MRAGFRRIAFQRIVDGIDGVLNIAERGRQIPFSVKRVYWITDLSHKGAVRGMHAHRRLQQVLVCVSGSFDLELYDGRRRTVIAMKGGAQGVFVGPNVWMNMRNFSRPCTILVLASDVYRESDYIRDFREFGRRLKAKSKRPANAGA